jgi:hypothetical protein
VPPIREGGIGSNFPAPPAQGGRANTNLQGDKKFVDRGDGATSFPGLQCEDQARHEEALVWAGHVTTKNGSI